MNVNRTAIILLLLVYDIIATNTTCVVSASMDYVPLCVCESVCVCVCVCVCVSLSYNNYSQSSVV